jgi:hypothetical protein
MGVSGDPLRARLVAVVAAAWGYRDEVPHLVETTVDALMPVVEAEIDAARECGFRQETPPCDLSGNHP